MSIRTTVTLDDDVVARLRAESLARGIAFKALLNDCIRSGLVAMTASPKRKPFKVDYVKMGAFPGLNFDHIHELIE